MTHKMINNDWIDGVLPHSTNFEMRANDNRVSLDVLLQIFIINTGSNDYRSSNSFQKICNSKLKGSQKYNNEPYCVCGRKNFVFFFVPPFNSCSSAGLPVAIPVKMTPSARKNSAALAVSIKFTSAVIAWELKYIYDQWARWSKITCGNKENNWNFWTCVFSLCLQILKHHQPQFFVGILTIGRHKHRWNPRQPHDRIQNPRLW